MRILIMGGSSSLGRALGPVLSSLGEVITAGRSRCDIELDLTAPFETMRLPAVDVVVNTAAHFGGNDAQAIHDAENVNVLGTLKLGRAAVLAGAEHFILVSTMFVSLSATSPYFGSYALSKRHSEEVARLLSTAHSLRLAILRPSQMYGDDDSFRTHQPFLYSIVDKAEQGKDITIRGTNDPRRNYIHVDDVALIVREAIRRRIEGSYSCMNGEDTSYGRIAKAAFAAFGQKGEVRFLEDEPDVPDNVFERDDSLMEAIGFRPRISMEEGMNRIAAHRGVRGNAVIR